MNRNEEEQVKAPITSEPLKVPVMSESDTDSVLSAGEAAKNRRIQAKARTTTSEEEVDEEDIEARMAMVNHYTEIVQGTLPIGLIIEARRRGGLEIV